MTKWSYKREAIYLNTSESDARPNALGRLGWELKFVRFSEDSMFPSSCIFMRPQPTEAEADVMRMENSGSLDSGDL